MLGVLGLTVGTRADGATAGELKLVGPDEVGVVTG